jgi:hypothetical protein
VTPREWRLMLAYLKKRAEKTCDDAGWAHRNVNCAFTRAAADHAAGEAQDKLDAHYRNRQG